MSRLALPLPALVCALVLALGISTWSRAAVAQSTPGGVTDAAPAVAPPVVVEALSAVTDLKAHAIRRAIVTELRRTKESADGAQISVRIGEERSAHIEVRT